MPKTLGRDRREARKPRGLDVGAFLKANPHIIRDEIDDGILADLRKAASRAKGRK